MHLRPPSNHQLPLPSSAGDLHPSAGIKGQRVVEHSIAEDHALLGHGGFQGQRRRFGHPTEYQLGLAGRSRLGFAVCEQQLPAIPPQVVEQVPVRESAPRQLRYAGRPE